MASTQRAEPRESTAPVSPAASIKLQGKHHKKKQKRGANSGSNNGSHTRSNMCEAPEARWPGSSTAATVVQPVPATAGVAVPAAMSSGSRSSCDGDSRCQPGGSRCACEALSNGSHASSSSHVKAAANDGSSDAAGGGSGGHSGSGCSKQSTSSSSSSRQQRRHGGENSSSTAGGGSRGAGGSSGSGDDGEDDDGSDAWRRRKLAGSKTGAQKQHHKQQGQGQLSEDGTTVDVDADSRQQQQQQQQQQAVTAKVQGSSPPRVNGYVKGHGPKHSHQPHQEQQAVPQPDVQLQALSAPAAGEQHSWMSIQFGDLPSLLGTSPDCSPGSAGVAAARKGQAGQPLQTIVSMPGIHHSSSAGCVAAISTEQLLSPQQLQRRPSRSVERKQQRAASAELCIEQFAADAMLLAGPAAAGQAQQQHTEVAAKLQNGRTLPLQEEQQQQQRSGKAAAPVNGKYSSKAAVQQQQQHAELLVQQAMGLQQRQQQQQDPVNGVPQLKVPQQQQQLRQHAGGNSRKSPAAKGAAASSNGTSSSSSSRSAALPAQPHSPAGDVLSDVLSDMLSEAVQLSPALLQQFGLRVGRLNGSLASNELQLRAAIEQAGVGAVLVARDGDSSSSPAGQGSKGASFSPKGSSSSSSKKEGGSAGQPPCSPSHLGKGSAGASSSHGAGAAHAPVNSPAAGNSSSRASHRDGDCSSPRAAGSKQGSRGQQQQQPHQPPPMQLQVQVPDAGVDDCSIVSSSSSVQASSTTSNPWQQHEAAAAVLQQLNSHHGANSGSISARAAHGPAGFGPGGLGGLHPQHMFAGSVSGGLSHSSSPHLSSHMDQSDIMSDPGTVPGGGFGLGEGYGGGYSRLKPGRNRFMPHHHLGSNAGGFGYGGVAGPSAGRHHHLQEQPLLMQHLANGAPGGGRGGGRRGGRDGGSSGSRDGDAGSGRGSNGSRDADGSGRRGGSSRRNSKGSGMEYGLPRSPQMSQGSGGSWRSFDNRGSGNYAAAVAGQDGGSGSGRGSGRQTPLLSPGGRGSSSREQHGGSSSGRPSPHLAGSSSSNSLAGHPSPLLLPEPALAAGGPGSSSSTRGIAPMQDLPPSAASAAGLPPHGPSTDLERFLAVVGPTVPVNPAMPLQQVLKGLTLKSVFDLFLEPSLWGTPVGTLGGPRGPSTAYYVPYMSAMQLFTTVAEPAGPAPSPPPPPASSSSSGNSSSSGSAGSSPTPSSCSAGSSSGVSYAAVAAGAAAGAGSAQGGGSGSGSASPSPGAAAAAAAAAASTSIQVGPGGRGRLYTCSVKGWPPVMRLLLEHMEQELPFSRDPFYIQLEAMAGGQEAVEAAAAEAVAASDASSSSSAATGRGADAGCPSPGATPAPANSYTACGYPLVGPDLMTTRVMDVHPASWFAVAWYPVYRIPDAPLTARFLTFYSFAQLLEVLNDAVSAARADLAAPCNLAGLPMPVVGMKWYNLMGERWLELLGTPGNGHQPLVSTRRGSRNDARAAAAAAAAAGDGDQPLMRLAMPPMRFREWQARLEDLQSQAARLSKGSGLKVVTPQGPKEVRLYHSDYEFFNSRG